MNDLSFLTFQADFSSPRMMTAYDELPLWSAMFGLLLLEEVPFRNVKAALDVGCGTGFPLIELAERLGSRTEVHGIDPWTAGLQRAAAKIASRETPNVRLHEGTAAAMPFADGTFDLIVSNLGVNNFDDRVAVMRELRRVAAEGAILALTTNLQGHMQEFYEVFESVLKATADEEAAAALREHVGHRATVESVTDLLVSSGFTVRRVVERKGRIRFASGTALLNHHFIKLGFLDGWKSVVAGKERAVFARLQRELDALADSEGELALTIPMAYIEATTT